jgi:acyl carrier protein
MNVIKKLLPIFQNIFDDDNLIITNLTAAKDISEWDSLAHIRLIVAIEKSFNLRFSANEISKLKNVGDVVDLIMLKKKNV